MPESLVIFTTTKMIFLYKFQFSSSLSVEHIWELLKKRGKYESNKKLKNSKLKLIDDCKIIFSGIDAHFHVFIDANLSELWEFVECKNYKMNWNWNLIWIGF